MSKFKRYFIILLALWLIVATLLVFVFPPLLKTFLISKLSSELDRTIYIDNISVNPFELSVSLRSVSVSNTKRDDEFLSFDELYINLETLSLIRQALVVKNLILKNPSIRIVRNKDKTYNISDIVNSLEKPEKPEKSKYLFSINNINISNAHIVFIDNPMNKTHKIENLTVHIPFLSNIPTDTEVVLTPLLEGKFNGRDFRFTGQTRPFIKSLETDFNIRINALDIPQFLDYIPLKIPIKIEKALLNTDLNIKFTQFSDREPLINLQGNCWLNSVKINYLDGSKWLSFENLSVSMLSTDLIRKEFHFDSIVIVKPVTYQQRDEDGNFKMPKFSEPKRDKKQDNNAQVKLKINKVSLKDGTTHFLDYTNSRTFRTTIRAMDLSISDFSTEQNAKTKAELNLETAFKESMSLKADFAISPFSMNGNMSLKNVAFKNYLPFYEDKVLFELTSGVSDISFDFEIKDANKILLSEIAIDIRSLRLKHKNEDKAFLSIPILSLKDASLDMQKKTIDIGSIATRGADINLVRYKDKKLNLENLIATKKDNSSASLDGPHISEDNNPDRDWLLRLTSLKINNYKLSFVDNALLGEPFTANLKNINISAKNLSTAKNLQGRINMSSRLNDRGMISLDGILGINPLKTNFKIRANNIGLSDFQPYVQQRANLELYDGYVSLKGDCHLMEIENSLRGSFRGESSITDLKSKDDEGEDLLKWKSLYIGIVDMKVFPLNISIDEIALSDFYSKIIINKDTTLNLQRLIKRDKEIEPETSSSISQKSVNSDSTKDKYIKIGKITLQGGHINFTDNHINPPYSANLLEIGGRVSGMMSKENSSADVDLKGRLENYAPLDISGKINPLLKDLFVDLKIDFRNIDLTPLTSYSGKYVGYTIEKGKLSLQMKYLIEERRLEASNNIFLDQFTFGQSVDSPDATRLPVKLAVALLKNRKGEIDLDVPVSGSLDDPKFSLGGIIWKAILNILLKVATAPFAILGSLLGTSDEASYLEFGYGSDIITPEGTKKLDNIARALTERPGIRIELQGLFDTDNDKEGLKKEVLNRKLKLIKARDTKTSIDSVTINTDEYSKYLKLAYKDEKFPKPRNIFGLVKDLPDGEIEKLMLTHIVISENDLKRLAFDRAMKIKDYLVINGKIDPTRIFLIESSSDQSKDNKARKSRVDFKLSA